MEKTENKKFFKNKLEMIITCLIFIACIIGFIVIGKMDFTKDDPTDNVVMNQVHPEIPVDNVYEIINAKQANTFILRSNVIILFGTKNEWTGYYAKLLNEVAKEEGINKIYYYDFEDDRARNNATYENIVRFLSNYTVHLDDNSTDLYGPTLVIINKGVISVFDDDTAIMHGKITPKEYWNEYNINLKKNTLTSAFNDYRE